MMKVRRRTFDEAEQAGVLEPGQGDALWEFCEGQLQGEPRFHFSHILYYLGGGIAIAAMSLLLTVSYDRWGGPALPVLGLAYGLACWRAGLWLLEVKKLPLPAGILLTLTVVVVPVAVYGLEAWLGYWPEGGPPYDDYHHLVNWRWLAMELATLAVAAVLLARYRLPFMVMPVAVTLWYLGMDIGDWIAAGLSADPADGAGAYDWQAAYAVRRTVSILFGLAMLGLALGVDIRTRRLHRDFAFWLYLFGLMSFWGGVTALDPSGELGRAGYCLLNLGLILVGALLQRRAFTVFGALGIALYLGHLAYDVFEDELVFSLALSAIGLAIVAGGVWWSRHGETLGGRWRRALSPRFAELIEARQA